MGLANSQASTDLLRGHALTKLLPVVEMNKNLWDESNNPKSVREAEITGRRAEKRQTEFCAQRVTKRYQNNRGYKNSFSPRRHYHSLQ